MSIFERLTGTLLVALGEPAAEAEAAVVRYALVQGRQLLRRGEIEADRLASLGGYEVRASFFDRSAYFGRVGSQTSNARLAGVVARRFVDGELLFNEPYRLRLSVHPTGEHDFQLRLIAASELGCVRAEGSLPLDSRPVGLASLEELAIAALVARVTPAPAMVCFARGARFIAFVCEAGEVRSRNVEMLPGGELGAAQDAASRAEAMLLGGLGNAAPGDVNIGIKLYLGDLRPLAAEAAAQRDYASREVEKKMGLLVRGGDALAEPELFGLRFVGSRWNLLEPDQALRAWAWKAALPVSGLMAAGALTLAGLGVATAYENSRKTDEIGRQRQQVEQQRAELEKRVPDSGEVSRIRDLTDLLQKREEQVRVDHLLAWLTRQIPEGASIASLHMFPPGETPPEVLRKQTGDGGGGTDILARLFGAKALAKPDAQEAPAQNAAAAKQQPGEYELTLELILPGAYEHSEKLAGEIVGRLAGRGRFKQSTLAYDAPANRAVLRSQLTIQAKDFR